MFVIKLHYQSRDQWLSFNEAINCVEKIQKKYISLFHFSDCSEGTYPNSSFQINSIPRHCLLTHAPAPWQTSERPSQKVFVVSNFLSFLFILFYFTFCFSEAEFSQPKLMKITKTWTGDAKVSYPPYSLIASNILHIGLKQNEARSLMQESGSQ